MFYVETARFDGRWSPQVWRVKPVIASVAGVKRIRYAEGFGPRVRFVTPMNRADRQLTLDEAQDFYAPEAAKR